jgi:hypothetical protein
MKFQEHCYDSILLFGDSFKEVHAWLDEFAGKSPYGMRHRKKRHHLQGIEEVRGLFGNKVAECDRQHIISDLKMEGWTEDDHFPSDENDYVRMGLY